MPPTRPQLAALLTALALAGLSGCAPQTALVATPQSAPFRGEKPEGAAPDTCWDKLTTPAIIETVTRQVQTRPAKTAPDGSVIRPARFRTETVQNIVQEREERWFETLCPEQLTPDFIAALQRALTVRGYYVWPITSTLDRNSRAAIRQYQATQGLDTATLAMSTAQQLGLAVVDTPGRS